MGQTFMCSVAKVLSNVLKCAKVTSNIRSFCYAISRLTIFFDSTRYFDCFNKWTISSGFCHFKANTDFRFNRKWTKLIFFALVHTTRNWNCEKSLHHHYHIDCFTKSNERKTVPPTKKSHILPINCCCYCMKMQMLYEITGPPNKVKTAKQFANLISICTLEFSACQPDTELN